MKLRRVETVSEIIDLLGGPTAVSEITGHSAPQAVSNWRAAGAFPPKTFLVLSAALIERGYSAPASLWQMIERESA